MAIAAYCRRDVATIDLGATVREAAEQMASANVGYVVVQDERRVRGIVTDRDLALRTAREGIDPATRLADFVEPDLVVVHEDRPTRLALLLMRKHAVRRLPVLDDRAQLVGVVEWDDLVALVARELADVAATLASQRPALAVPPSRALVELSHAGETA